MTEPRPQPVRIHALVNRGWSVPRVAAKLHLSTAYVYRTCRKYNWPINPPLTNRYRRNVVAASRVLNLKELCRAYRTTPDRIREVLSDSDRTARRTYG